MPRERGARPRKDALLSAPRVASRMAKVSVGLRGWRFDEEEIFTDDEELKPLDEIPEEPRERLVRLVGLVEEPCDVCYLSNTARPRSTAVIRPRSSTASPTERCYSVPNTSRI